MDDCSRQDLGKAVSAFISSRAADMEIMWKRRSCPWDVILPPTDVKSDLGCVDSQPEKAVLSWLLCVLQSWHRNFTFKQMNLT